jgi:epoxyqueuosine reductase
MGLNPDAIKSRAGEIGFDLCGIARAEKHSRLSRLAEWIGQGRHGDMQYLADSVEERLDPARVLPTARSIVSVACVYNTNQPYSTETEAGRAAIARYAWGDDYHDVLRHRLRALVEWMAGVAGPGFEAFSCVDSGPVQERVFAEQAGLGWIGKNTCLINARLGSWMFLAEVLTNADLAPDPPGVDQCGTCTRCLDACPTGAIVEPYGVDATRCLSYLTIESHGSVDESARPSIAQQVYGCDICQDVCPWNRRAATSADAAWQPRDGLVHPRLIDLCRLTDDAWRTMLKKSAMRRAGLRRIRRSLAYAAASLPAAEADVALDALASHASAADAAVADGIRWARARSRSNAIGTTTSVG